MKDVKVRVKVDPLDFFPTQVMKRQSGRVSESGVEMEGFAFQHSKKKSNE